MVSVSQPYRCKGIDLCNVVLRRTMPGSGEDPRYTQKHIYYTMYILYIALFLLSKYGPDFYAPP